MSHYRMSNYLWKLVFTLEEKWCYVCMTEDGCRYFFGVSETEILSKHRFFHHSESTHKNLTLARYIFLHWVVGARHYKFNAGFLER